TCSGNAVARELEASGVHLRPVLYCSLGGALSRLRKDGRSDRRVGLELPEGTRTRVPPAPHAHLQRGDSVRFGGDRNSADDGSCRAATLRGPGPLLPPAPARSACPSRGT